jgi:hypothetical protein
MWIANDSVFNMPSSYLFVLLRKNYENLNNIQIFGLSKSISVINLLLVTQIREVTAQAFEK